MLQRAQENIERYFSFVGVIERFDECLFYLGKKYEWPSFYYKTPTSAATPLKSKFLSFTLLTYRKRCGQ